MRASLIGVSLARPQQSSLWEGGGSTPCIYVAGKINRLGIGKADVSQQG